MPPLRRVDHYTSENPSAQRVDFLIWGKASEKYQEMQMQYICDAWGNLIIEAVYPKNRGGLSALRIIIAPANCHGYQYDVEIGLYYVENRFCSPALCRFINTDKHSDIRSGILGTSMYAYRDNSSIMHFVLLKQMR